jgi:hypothetical protein
MRAFATIILTLILSVNASAWSCPMCKDAVNTQSAAVSTEANIAPQTRGYYYSIVAMVSMPFMLVGGITWGLVREQRQLARQPK